MDSQLNAGEGFSQGSSRGRNKGKAIEGAKEGETEKQGYAMWGIDESRMLLRLLVEEVGGRLNNGCYRKDVIEGIILPQINARFKKNKKYAHYKNKVRNWKQRIEPIEKLMACTSGFGWDPVTQRFTAPDEVWEDIQKAHPDAANVRDKYFEDFEDIRLVVGGTSASGRDAGGVGLAGVDARVFERRDDAVDVEDEDMTPIGTQSIDVDIPSDSSSFQTEGSDGSKRRKRAAGSSRFVSSGTTLQELAESVAIVGEAMQKLNTHLDAMNRRKNPDPFLEALEQTPNLDKDMRWDAVDVLDTPQLREAFMRMDPGDRGPFIERRMRLRR